MQDITEAALRAQQEATKRTLMQLEMAKLKEAARTARKELAAMKGAHNLTAEMLRSAITTGPLNEGAPNWGLAPSAELSAFNRNWRKLLAMLRAPANSIPRLKAEGLLRQLDVYFVDEGKLREFRYPASAWKDKPAVKPTSEALGSVPTTSTGAKVW